MKRFLLILLCCASVYAQEPVLIFTYVYNRPDFIALHAKTFRAFFKEKYEYIVFNDAPDRLMSRQIEQMCAALKVRCIRVPQHAPNRQHPSCRHMDGIQYSLDLLGYRHNGKVMMVDADMFLVRPFSINEYMREHDFIGGYQDREGDGNKIVYSAPCLVFMNMAQLPDKTALTFEGGTIEGFPCDVGGQTYYYFKKNPTLSLKLFIAYSKDYFTHYDESPAQYGCDEGSVDFLMNNKREYGFQFHADGSYLHFYAGGSNWPKYDANFIQDKTDLVNRYIDKQIAYYKNANS